MKRRIWLWILIGGSWGIVEWVGFQFLKPIFPAGSIGAGLTGFSIFFLGLAIFSSLPVRDLFLIALITAIIKPFGLIAFGHPSWTSCLSGSLWIYGLETAVFAAAVTWIPCSIQRFSRFPLLWGAGIATFSAALFPLNSLLFGLPGCARPGTSIPLSFFYLPVSMICGAVALWSAHCLNMAIKKARPSRTLTATSDQPF